MNQKKKHRLESFLPWDTASITQHLELMARKGLSEKLWTSQAQWYQ